MRSSVNSLPWQIPKRSAAPLLIAALLMLGLAANVLGDTSGWPREFEASQGNVLVYQPQVETFDGSMLTARAAVAVTPEGETEPRFGVVWFAARVRTDRDARVVYLEDLNVPQVRFPEAKEEKAAKLSEFLEAEIPQLNMSTSLDRILASMNSTSQEIRAAADLRLEPPRIIYAATPSVLISIDGEPRLKKIGEAGLMRVMNTAYVLLFDTPGKTYYLYGGNDAWYTATDLAGDWKLTGEVPSSVAVQAPADAGSGSQVVSSEDTNVVPRIIVSTRPGELISTSGEPALAPVEDGKLMYVTNTDSDIFLEVATQKYFVLLSGRWYTGKALEGPWSSVPSNRLPKAFGEIPADSEVGDVRDHVAGTQEANEAITDAQIPQTTTVRPGLADVKVTYDGEPQFQVCEGTELAYAINSPDPVLKAGKDYFVCQDGVWFVSESPYGLWNVATRRPPGVEEIPPSCPVYPVKYVYIYEATPEVIYVGYTPGYTGAYVYGGTVVYGTGYEYDDWYEDEYYIWPVTWGYGAYYSPWVGWWGWRAAPWNPRGPFDPRGALDPRGPFDPRGPRDPRGPHDSRGLAGPGRGVVGGGNPRGVYDSRGAYDPRSRAASSAAAVPRVGPSTRGGPDPRGPADAGGSRGPGDVGDSRGDGRASGAPGGRAPVRAGERPNNLYGDRDGNVHRHDGDDWHLRANKGWSPGGGGSDLEREHSSRERGSHLSSPSRATPSRPPAGGGRRR